MSYIYGVLVFICLLIALPIPAFANMILPPHILALGLGIAILFIAVLTYINGLIEYFTWKILFRKYNLDWSVYRKKILKINAITFIPTQILAFIIFANHQDSAQSISEFYTYPWQINIAEVIPFFAEFFLLKSPLSDVLGRRDFIKGVLWANGVTFMIGLILQILIFSPFDTTRVQQSQNMQNEYEIWKNMDHACTQDSDCKLYENSHICFKRCASDTLGNSLYLGRSTGLQSRKNIVPKTGTQNKKHVYVVITPATIS